MLSLHLIGEKANVIILKLSLNLKNDRLIRPNTLKLPLWTKALFKKNQFDKYILLVV